MVRMLADAKYLLGDRIFLSKAARIALSAALLFGGEICGADLRDLELISLSTTLINKGLRD